MQAESLACVGAPQLVLVTSSALCEGPLLAGLGGSMSSLDEFEMSGDGMALPLGDVRRWVGAWHDTGPYLPVLVCRSGLPSSLRLRRN
jgi:hypothetical protein